MIIETVVKTPDKMYRILNLHTGQVYASSFQKESEAIDAVEHGQIRAGMLVVFISRQLLCEMAFNDLASLAKEVAA